MSVAADCDLPALNPRGADRWRWVVRALSLGLVVLVAAKFLRTNPAALRAALPDSFWFWPTLLALYFTLPAADWIIFRRIWRLPLAGFPILAAKRISNELLLMYSGEVYFYLWARRRAGLTTTPFATIRDVNVLSALAGNALCLVLVLAAAPFFDHLNLAPHRIAIIASAIVITAAPALILLFSRRLFVLKRAESGWVFCVHVARLVLGCFLVAQLWRLSLPEAPMTLWMALAAARLFISRLPLGLNSELLFAAVAGGLVGDATEVAAVISMTAMATLGLHVVVAGCLGLHAFLAPGREDGVLAGPGAP